MGFPFPLFSLLSFVALVCGDSVGGDLGPWRAGIPFPGQLVKLVELRRPKYVFLRIAKSAGPLVYLPRSWESPQRETNKPMSKKTTTIRGHKVTLETDGDWSGCWIESGNYSGSLEVLRDTGCLSDVGAWTEVRVNSGTIAAIESWAEANGY